MFSLNIGHSKRFMLFPLCDITKNIHKHGSRDFDSQLWHVVYHAILWKGISEDIIDIHSHRGTELETLKKRISKRGHSFTLNGKLIQCKAVF